MGERFGITGGTVRVALSRMVERGELINHDGEYALAGVLVERQERQDRSRQGGELEPWDGTWEQVVVTASGRTSSERTKLRRNLATLGLGELREGVWMRPANLDPTRLPSARATIHHQVDWFTIGPLIDDEAVDLLGRLFDLDHWALTASGLQAAISQAQRRLDHDDDAVVSGFNLASATLRHLVHDPRLPPSLTPECWPADNLRQSYEGFELAYQQLLRGFFRTVT